MAIRAITFDCAQTLIEVDWQPDLFATQVATSLNISVPAEGRDLYRRAYAERYPEFLALNLRRDPLEGSKFYEELNRDWLTRIGADPAKAGEMSSVAEEWAFGKKSSVFRIFSETLETLRSLQEQGYILAVISNWDYSLHRVLEMFGIDKSLAVAVASLEEGFEKPDPRLFQIALNQMGCTPSETLHIGDDPIDDVQGALESGIKAILIDRAQPSDLPCRISSLTQIVEAIRCLN